MSTAVVFEQPGKMALRPVQLPEPHSTDCVIEVRWTGISTGTERLLWDGRMPPFPGLAYPLVPGYESVGNVIEPGKDTQLSAGQRVFVPGSRGFTDVHGLFGGAAQSLVVPADRLISLPSEMESTGVLLALAATACHALGRMEDLGPPELIIGHGALGRLIARVAEARYHATPVVWETAAERREGNHSYTVIDPKEDDRRDYRRVCVSAVPISLLIKLYTILQRAPRCSSLGSTPHRFNSISRPRSCAKSTYASAPNGSRKICKPLSI